MVLGINELAAESHQISRDHGFWSGPENDNVPTKLALIHSEISEALEAFRSKDMDLRWVYTSSASTPPDFEFKSERGGPAYWRDSLRPDWQPVEDEYELMTGFGFTAKPEGFGIELADAVIRICDLAANEAINLEYLISLKTEYNKTRPMMHGGKRV